MREVTVTGWRWMQDNEGAWLALRVPSPQSAMDVCDALQSGKEYTAAIKRKGRSLDANAYFWCLADKLAAHYHLRKEDIYRQKIQEIAGVSDVLCIQEKAVDAFCRAWQGRGLGWIAEPFESKIGGCVNVTVYYGSSTYDTEQMSQLIESTIGDCREAGIETLPPWKVAAMTEQWRSAVEFRNGVINSAG